MPEKIGKQPNEMGGTDYESSQAKIEQLLKSSSVEERRQGIRRIVRENGERGQDYFEIGDRVRLKMMPSRDINGQIVDMQEAIIMRTSGSQVVLAGENYKAKWDNPEYGESGWLPASEFEGI